jgi:pentafunctional AROM polypeptide
MMKKQKVSHNSSDADSSFIAQECAPPAPPPRKTIPVIGNSVVHVGRGLLSSIPSELTPANGIKASKFVIVTDETVGKLYGKKLVDAFLALGGIKSAACLDPAELAKKPMGFADMCSCGQDFSESDDDNKILLTYQVPTGENSKCRKVKAEIEDFMLAHRCNRDTCMIALGGGVVGDLVGYVAATYMRGIPVVQIPTSTTAMIDSSIGGKTAINVPAGKNLIGAFHQPVMVFADMDLLATLGKRELVEGIAEAIKMGCIRIPSLFELLEKEPEKVMALEPDIITQVMYDSMRGKAEVVAADEKEAGLRGTLNWGHTIGHAIEALLSPAVMHGECVSIGCVAEGELSRRYHTTVRTILLLMLAGFDLT